MSNEKVIGVKFQNGWTGGILTVWKLLSQYEVMERLTLLLPAARELGTLKAGEGFRLRYVCNQCKWGVTTPRGQLQYNPPEGLRLNHHLKFSPHPTALNRWIYHPSSLPNFYSKSHQLQSKGSTLKLTIREICFSSTVRRSSAFLSHAQLMKLECVFSINKLPSLSLSFLFYFGLLYTSNCGISRAYQACKGPVVDISSNFRCDRKKIPSILLWVGSNGIHWTEVLQRHWIMLHCTGHILWVTTLLWSN